MESVKEQMMFIVYNVDGWYIVDGTFFVLAGPYETHNDAVAQLRTRVWRIKQGWAP
jgi:hypothetical protein